MATHVGKRNCNGAMESFLLLSLLKLHKYNFTVSYYDKMLLTADISVSFIFIFFE
jgi:hypothetical protein